MKFRKKPVVIDAQKWDGSRRSTKEVLEFLGQQVAEDTATQKRFDEYVNICQTQGIQIKTLEGVMVARIEDYIIKGVNGELYPCKPEIFAKTYETADTPAIEPLVVQWTSVKDGLPEEKVSVLVAYIGCNDKKVYADGCARLDDGWKWTLDDGLVEVEITHWMPLPEPPQEETQ